MIDKIVLYTKEKATHKQIPMVLICRDSAEKDSGKVQVIFGAVKPSHFGRSLLPFNRMPIVCANYELLGMDLTLPRRIRHTDFRYLPQEVAWDKAMRCADRFIMKASSMGPSPSGNTKYSKTYTGSEVIETYAPPIAVLITNSNNFGKSMNKAYNSTNKNE